MSPSVFKGRRVVVRYRSWELSFWDTVRLMAGREIECAIPLKGLVSGPVPIYAKCSQDFAVRFLLVCLGPAERKASIGPASSGPYR